MLRNLARVVARSYSVGQNLTKSELVTLRSTDGNKHSLASIFSGKKVWRGVPSRCGVAWRGVARAGGRHAGRARALTARRGQVVVVGIVGAFTSVCQQKHVR